MAWIEQRKHGCRLLDYTWHGLRAITLENRSLRVTVLPDKGSDIVELRLKALDLDVLFQSPTGLRDPRTTLPSDAGMGAMMDFYEGGWQEILPSGGPPSGHAGAQWGQHGETTTLPWDVHVEADEQDHVAISLRVRLIRYPLSVRKTIHLRDDRSILEIEEVLTNESNEPIDMMWGHHPTVGAPFLSDACRFYVPHGTVRTPSPPSFPRQQAAHGRQSRWSHVPSIDGGVLDLSIMPSPDACTAEFLYVTDLQEGWYAMVNEDLHAGFGLCWDVAIFPHLWYWQVAHGSFGYPWYGRTYSMALEPWTSWPGDGLAAAVAQGTARQLAPRETIATTVSAILWTGHNSPLARLTHDGPVWQEQTSSEEEK